MDKLFTAKSRTITSPSKMSLLLEAVRTSAVVIQPRRNLVMHTDTTSRDKCSLNTSIWLLELNMIVRTTSKTAVQLTRCYKNTLLLTYKLGTACAIEMAVESDKWSELPSGATTITCILGQEHQSSGGQEFLHVHELGQSPADHNRIQLQSRGPQRHDETW